MTEKRFNIGIDIGKRHDPSAFAAAVAEQREDGNTHFNVHFIKRLPLGMPYPDQGKQLISWAEAALDRFKHEINKPYSGPYPYIRVDLTGVGDPLIDMIKPILKDRFFVVSCRFQHGGRLTPFPGGYNVGKALFASRLQVLSESGRIHLPPDDPESKQLALEMLDYDIDVDDEGKETYGAIRPGTHDDMVTAFGLACLIDPERHSAMQFTAPPGGVVSSGAVRFDM